MISRYSAAAAISLALGTPALAQQEQSPREQAQLVAACAAERHMRLGETNIAQDIADGGRTLNHRLPTLQRTQNGGYEIVSPANEDGIESATIYQPTDEGTVTVTDRMVNRRWFGGFEFRMVNSEYGDVHGGGHFNSPFVNFNQASINPSNLHNLTNLIMHVTKDLHDDAKRSRALVTFCREQMGWPTPETPRP